MHLWCQTDADPVDKDQLVPPAACTRAHLLALTSLSCPPHQGPALHPQALAASTGTVKLLRLPAQENTLFALKGVRKKSGKKALWETL